MPSFLRYGVFGVLEWVPSGGPVRAEQVVHGLFAVLPCAHDSFFVSWALVRSGTDMGHLSISRSILVDQL